MKLKFECTSTSKNPAPPGQPPTYNFTWMVVPDDDGNRQQFGGIPVGQLTVSGLREQPLGYEQTIMLDLGGAEPPAPPAPQARPVGTGPRRFGGSQEQNRT